MDSEKLTPEELTEEELTEEEPTEEETPPVRPFSASRGGYQGRSCASDR